MTGYKSIPLLFLLAAPWLSGATAAGRAVITPVQIAEAISETGMRVTTEQVTLLADAVSTTPTPMLRVQSMEQWGEHRMKVRMACASNDQCLPFFVAVYRSEASPFQPAPASANTSTVGRAAARPDARSYIVRAGAPARLMIDGDHVHIELLVTCLENGAAGQTIRVASSDRRQTYMAEVVDGTLLRGRL
jgi:hypothetical protein